MLKKFFLSFIFILTVTFLGAQSSPMDSLAKKYVNWLTGEDVDYVNPEVMQRYNSFISSGKGAMDLSAYDFINPGKVWDLTDKTDKTSYSQLVELKLVRLVFLYVIKGPSSNPNPDFHSAKLKTTILTIFDYLKVKGVNSNTDFDIPVISSNEAIISSSVALRSSAYAVSILLMKDELMQKGEFNHHMGALGNLTAMLDPDTPVFSFTIPGYTADVLRATSVQRFCYLLAQDNTVSTRESDMYYLRDFLNNSLKISYGWADCIKPDFITYHHRGAYSNTYGLDAMHVMTILNYMLSNTKFKLNATAQQNLKNAVFNYTRFSIGFEMPRALAGRFPNNTDAINGIRPAFAYLYLTDPINNADMGREFIRLWNISSAENLNLQRSNTTSMALVHGLMGIQNMVNVVKSGLSASVEPVGHFCFPYAGLSVHKRSGYQVSVKGTSKHIWDFENSINENVFGRYTSAGSMEILTGGLPISHTGSGLSLTGWDWSHFPGTTTTYLSFTELGSGDFRQMNDRNFLANASLDQNGAFAIDYADYYSKTNMSAFKSFFFVDDKILCLGAGIQDKNGTSPIHTTLFQTALKDKDSITILNGNPISGINFIHKQVAGTAWMTDAVGNGFVIPANPANKDEIIIQRIVQNSRNESNTSNTSGNFVSAYINHGAGPANAQYQYAIAIKGGAKKTADLAKNFNSYFNVIRQDMKAHIALYIPDSIYNYVVFDTSLQMTNGWVKQVNRPSVIMTQPDKSNTLKLSLTNPNLGLLKDDEHYTWKEISANAAILNKIPQKDFVIVTLKGEWELIGTFKGVSLISDGTSTFIKFETINGKTMQIKLKKVIATNTSEIAQQSFLKVYPNPTDGWVTAFIESQKIISLHITDLNGREVTNLINRKNGVGCIQLDFSFLASGIYLLNINNYVVKIVR